LYPQLSNVVVLDVDVFGNVRGHGVVGKLELDEPVCMDVNVDTLNKIKHIDLKRAHDLESEVPVRCYVCRQVCARRRCVIVIGEVKEHHDTLLLVSCLFDIIEA
jgi:hypothetical protein